MGLVGYLGGISALPRDLRWFLAFNLLSNIGIGVFFVLFNLYLVELGLREDFIGAYQSLTTLALGLAALPLGRLINRVGALRCMRWGVGAFVATSALLALIVNPAVVLVLGVLNGLATALLAVPNMPFAMERATDDNRTYVSAISFSVNSLSVTAGTLLGGMLPGMLVGLAVANWAVVDTYRATLLLGVVLAGLAWAPLALVRDRAAAHATSGTGLPSHVEQRQARRDVAVVAGSGALLALGTGSVVPFFNVYLTGQGLGAGLVGAVFSTSGLIASLAALLVPPLAARWGHLPALRVLRLFSVPFSLPLIFWPSAGLGVVAYATRNISFSMAWPAESAFVASRVPPAARAAAFSLRSAAWNLGYAAASFLAGLLIVRFGYGLAFASYCLFCTASALLFQIYFARRAQHAAAPSEESPVAQPGVVKGG